MDRFVASARTARDVALKGTLDVKYAVEKVQDV